MNVHAVGLIVAISLLCLATLSVRCLDDVDLKVNEARVLSVPRDSDYTTVVTLDGGGLRGLISAMVLVGFENAIKSYIVDNKERLLARYPSIKRADDFEVNLADYVDCFSGVSSGGWSALFLASKGKDSPIVESFTEHVMIAKYGKLAPGSAKALLVLYLEHGDVIFPHGTSLSGNGLPKDDDPLGRGVMRPIYQTKGIERVLEKFFGNITMADLKTTCVIPLFDLLSRTITLFIHDHLRERSQAEVVELRYRFDANMPGEKGVNSRVNFRKDVNFYTWDIARASWATPIYLPAKELTPIGALATEYIAVDGTMGGNSPILETIAYIINAQEMTSFEQLAVLSIGNGVPYEDYEDNANGGLAQWTSSGEMLHLYTNFIGDMVNSQLDFLFYSNPRVKPEQFLRIQKFEHLKSIDGFLLSIQDKSVYLREFQSIGEGLAASYQDSLRTFVENFVFGKRESAPV